MLETLSAVVTLALVALSVVIGLRLLRMAPWGSGRPELGLGLYFLISSGLGTALSVATYVGWSSAEIALSDDAARAINGSFFVVNTVGMICLLVFTQRTFRADSAGARAGVWALTAVMLLSLAWLAASEGFAVRVLNGAPYWIHWTARLAAMVWVAAESFHYWSLQRRRLVLGLADPVVSNRFLLWGVWSTVMTLMAFCDPLARLWYFHIAGTATNWVPEIGRPIIQFVVPVSCTLNLAAVALLVLTFFPVASYRRWVSARAPKAAHA